MTNVTFRQFVPVVYRSKTIHYTYSHKQIYLHISVTGFGGLLATIKQKIMWCDNYKESHKYTVINKSQINTNVNENVGEISTLTHRLYISTQWR